MILCKLIELQSLSFRLFLLKNLWNISETVKCLSPIWWNILTTFLFTFILYANWTILFLWISYIFHYFPVLLLPVFALVHRLFSHKYLPTLSIWFFKVLYTHTHTHTHIYIFYKHRRSILWWLPSKKIDAGKRVKNPKKVICISLSANIYWKV